MELTAEGLSLELIKVKIGWHTFSKLVFRDTFDGVVGWRMKIFTFSKASLKVVGDSI